MDARVLPKALIASVAGWLVYGVCFGFTPVLGSRPGGSVSGVGQFALVALVGLVAGGAGRLYTACFYAVHLRVEKRARSLVARIAAPTLAAVLVGGLGLLVPGVLGTGYGLMEAVTQRQVLLGLPLVVVLALPLAKIAGTALTDGSGGSGGIFGPGMVVGAGVGAALWRLAEPLGIAPHSPLVLVAVGMAACLGSVAHAPLGVLVMVAEMLGDASLLGPGMLAVLCAQAVSGRTTLYRSQLDRVGDVPEGATEAVPAAGAAATARPSQATEGTVVAPLPREPDDADPVVLKSTDPLSG
jgi:CIC family chloride channel protein